MVSAGRGQGPRVPPRGSGLPAELRALGPGFPVALHRRGRPHAPHPVRRGASRSWLDGFLPEIPTDGGAEWLPVGVVTDRTDGKLAHLDGLNLSRAWMLEGILAGLPADDPRRAGPAGRRRHPPRGGPGRGHRRALRGRPLARQLRHLSRHRQGSVIPPGDPHDGGVGDPVADLDRHRRDVHRLHRPRSGRRAPPVQGPVQRRSARPRGGGRGRPAPAGRRVGAPRRAS